LYLALFAASSLVLSAAVFFETRSAVRQQMTARIEAETGYLQGEYRIGGLEHLSALVRARSRGTGSLDYFVADSHDQRVVGEIPAKVGLASGWTTILVPDPEEHGGRPEKVLTLVSDLGGGMRLGVGGDFGEITDVEEAIATAFVGTVGLAALLGIGSGVLLSHAFLRRVDAITRTAEAIIGGDLRRRVPLRGTGDDLDHLAATLNLMLDQITFLMERLREVGSDVAHDLRTPLSRLYQRLDRARNRSNSVEEYQAAIDASLSDAEALLGIFSALLRIAQVESAEPRSSFRPVDLSTVAEAVIDAYGPDAEQAGRRLQGRLDHGVVIEGDQELLTQALANLVENALRHTPAGTNMLVRLSLPSTTTVELAVEDDGPGVPESDLEHLTERFYRGERSRRTPGNGLGLSLVTAVAGLHRAHLQIDRLAPGLRVRLLFRKAT
jgi:signal transduction histidine kinase